VLNAGFQIAQFWDGRAADLAAQAKGPILNPIEMAMPHEAGVLEKVRATAEYPAAFEKAFGKADALTYDNLARAIAAFERTLVTRDRFDDFLKGDDQALNSDELKGLDTFMNVGCVACHNGPLLGGNSFQKLGVVNALEKLTDEGRYAVTKDEADRFKFKVPTLRNIALTGPYFHDGETATLEEAVRRMSWHQLGQKLSDEQVRLIVTFLHTLTDKPRAGVLTASLR
jgi:cytochrome c peroxidase